MGVTDNFDFPYPGGSDDVDVPADIQALAESVDGKLKLWQAKKSLIPAEQSRTNTAYDYLGTPDKVTGLVLPAGGLIVVSYQARWKCSVGSNAGRAAIFIGANQVKAQSSGGPSAIETGCDGAADRYRPLFSSCAGLDSYSTPVGDGAADATTGQLLGMGGVAGAGGTHGGLALIFADAGTYDVGVQFKASSGSVTAKERKLWVLTLAFD